MKREVWVDYIKVLACILVVLGHFFQSMVKASILPDNNLYNWFNTSIYYFHVPLFFICSGYLYQSYSKVMDGKSWIKNVGKKAKVLVFLFSSFLSLHGYVRLFSQTLLIIRLEESQTHSFYILHRLIGTSIFCSSSS